MAYTPHEEVAYIFSVNNDLGQLSQHSSRVPDQHAQTPQTLNPFLSTNIPSYSYSASASLGSSDHNFLCVFYPEALPPPVKQPSNRRWHYRLVDWLNLRDWCYAFPWNDYGFSVKDIYICVDTDIIMVGSYYSSTTSKPR